MDQVQTPPMGIHHNMAHARRLSRLGDMVPTPLGAQKTVLDRPPELTRADERGPATGSGKRLGSVDAVFDAFELRDGAVLSFHHHYRNGDNLVNAVIERAHARGLKGLTLAASSLFPVHAPLVPRIEDGTIRHILTDYVRGPVADCIARGGVHGAVLMQSHGGRARAITARQIAIDAAFVAAPLARPDGAATGRGGQLACGPLGYPAVDAAFARRSVVVAAEITDAVMPHVDIPAHHVDAVVEWPDIGSTDGIQSGTTRPAQTEAARRIGALVTETMRAAGFLKNGMSLQSGAGGYSLAAVGQVGQAMAEQGITGSFLSGGITGVHTALLANGRFDHIRDVQCFDLDAVKSSISEPHHQLMTAEEYASPLYPSPVVDALDVMLLGAVEVDASFNVNAVVGADGTILGGPGGHPDTAAGAKLRIVTTNLTGGGFAKLVPNVRCVSTPGHDVDVIVTPDAIALHHARDALSQRLIEAGLPVRSFEELAARSAAAATTDPIPAAETPRALIEARDGRIADWI